MSYTNAYFKNDELDFPHPPLFLVWIGSESWDQSEYSRQRDPEKAKARKDKGKIRHVDSLDKAKKRVSGYAVSPRNCEYINRREPQYRFPHPSGPNVEWDPGEWLEDWAIYEWVDNEYVLRYSAKRGEFKGDCPLFQKLVKKGAGRKQRTVSEDAIEAAKLSILQAS